MRGCPGTCIYCDQFRISGTTADDTGPALSQAVEFLQRNKGKSRQIAFYGGSFTALDPAERSRLIDPLLPELDELASIRVSTHPLYIDSSVLDWSRAHRVTTIELGVQDFSDAVLAASGRGYTSDQAMRAALLTRRSGFELGIQLMPGLPGSDQHTILRNRQAVIELKPDLLRIYPCLVLKDTPLWELWSQGHYQPLTLLEAISQSADWQQLCDAQGIRLIKLGLPSNLSSDEVAAGPWHPAFGQLVKAELLVRRLENSYPPGSIIKLDKNQLALIMAHDRFYYNILRDRIANCSVQSL